ncbi:MAG: hypothetical protein AABW63_00250 [Nanoarchaeota archaeon]
MNMQFYVEKLKESEEYKKFMKENPKAFFCSGFFVIDKEGKDFKQHFDFYVPETKKIFSFYGEDNMKLVETERNETNVPDKIDFNIDLDFQTVEDMVLDRMEKEKIKNNLQKLLFSLQKSEGKLALIGTVFISKMALLKIIIDVKKKEISSFEKKSFFDMFKIIKQK